MKRATLSLTALILLLSFPTTATAQSRTTAEVVSIGDGDTLTVKENSEQFKVRLSCIDAPESTQRGGQASADRLKELLPQGTNVELRTIEQDRYGRSIAEAYKNGASVNLQLVQEGQAVVYDKYLDACESRQQKYLDTEAQAKSREIGFWALEDPVMPWDYREGKRSNSASPSKSSHYSRTETSDLPSCVNGDCDCSDFQNHATAQQVLEADSGDSHRLDRDSDGVACESLQ
ncbi:MAG: micrococcal nuclease-like nuclease [Cyanobacteria bacterium QH_9_48_43]|nr:MAG: micrococcal nuclease-like nuclease [Cyanobacteria bacterium QH_9_48_43]